MTRSFRGKVDDPDLFARIDEALLRGYRYGLYLADPRRVRD